MAEVVVGQGLGQLSAELWSQVVRHWKAAEWVDDGWDVRLLQSNVWIPHETGLLQFFGLVLLQHPAVEPEADLTLREVEHDADRALGGRQELLSDRIVLGHLPGVVRDSEIYRQVKSICQTSAFIKIRSEIDTRYSLKFDRIF